jgi:hypothetical protein
MRPADVVAIALSVSATASFIHGPACVPASSNAACLTKVLRLDQPVIFILRV